MNPVEKAATEDKVLAEFREIAEAKYAKLVVIVRNGRLQRVFTEQEKDCTKQFTEQGGRK
jgi:hypothetical protein